VDIEVDIEVDTKVDIQPDTEVDIEVDIEVNIEVEVLCGGRARPAYIAWFVVYVGNITHHVSDTSPLTIVRCHQATSMISDAAHYVRSATSDDITPLRQ